MWRINFFLFILSDIIVIDSGSYIHSDSNKHSRESALSTPQLPTQFNANKEIRGQIPEAPQTDDENDENENVVDSVQVDEGSEHYIIASSKYSIPSDDSSKDLENSYGDYDDASDSADDENDALDEAVHNMNMVPPINRHATNPALHSGSNDLLPDIFRHNTDQFYEEDEDFNLLRSDNKISEPSSSITQPNILTAFIGGTSIGLLFAILLAILVSHKIKRKRGIFRHVKYKQPLTVYSR